MKKVWVAALTILIAIGIIKMGHLLSVGQIATNANDKIPWGLDAVAYMFTGGAGAGAFLIAVLHLIGINTFKPIAKVALILSIVLVGIAPINLLLAMGHPTKIWMIFFTPNSSSVIMYGAYILLAFTVMSVLFAYFNIRRDMSGKSLSAVEIVGDNKKEKVLGFIGLLLALLVIGYTGILLGLSRARILWSTSLMPVIFFTSSIISALALLIIISKLLQKKCAFDIKESLFDKLGHLMLVGIFFDLLFLTGEILTAIYGRSGDHYESWSVLLSGQYVANFYLFQIMIGSIIPIYLLLTHRSSIKIVCAATCALIGVFAMRYNVIIGGQVVQPSGGPLGQYIPNLDEWLIAVSLWAVSGLLFTLAVQQLPLRSALENNFAGGNENEKN